MSSKRYTDEFKIEAVHQVTDRGFKVAGLYPVSVDGLIKA